MIYGKQGVVFYYGKRYKALKEGIKITRVIVYRFLLMYEQTGSIRSRDESGRPTKFTPEVLYYWLNFIDVAL